MMKLWWTGTRSSLEVGDTYALYHRQRTYVGSRLDIPFVLFSSDDMDSIPDFSHCQSSLHFQLKACCHPSCHHYLIAPPHHENLPDEINTSRTPRPIITATTSRVNTEVLRPKHGSCLEMTDMLNISVPSLERWFILLSWRVSHSPLWYSCRVNVKYKRYWAQSLQIWHALYCTCYTCGIDLSK